MSKTKIERGDIVTVWWLEGIGSWKDVVFQAGPVGPGDTYHLLVHGKPVLLNGNCPEFAYMELKAKGGCIETEIPIGDNVYYMAKEIDDLKAHRDELLTALEKTGDQREELAERVKKLEALQWTEEVVGRIMRGES